MNTASNGRAILDRIAPKRFSPVGGNQLILRKLASLCDLEEGW